MKHLHNVRPPGRVFERAGGTTRPRLGGRKGHSRYHFGEPTIGKNNPPGPHAKGGVIFESVLCLAKIKRSDDVVPRSGNEGKKRWAFWGTRKA